MSDDIKGVKFVDSPKESGLKYAPSKREWDELKRQLEDVKTDVRIAVTMAGIAFMAAIAVSFYAFH